MSENAAVKVAVRVRPLTPKEHLENTNECISYLPKTAGSTTQTLLLDTTRTYNFDYIFQPSSTQPDVFEMVEPMCSRFIDGYNVTTIAYGQTGSGKTFTMGTGLSTEGDDTVTGIIPRAINRIFEVLYEKQQEIPGFNYSLAVSFLELYNEELIDLLNPHTRTASRKGSVLSIREDASGNVYWAGVKEELVSEPEDLMSCLRKGSVCRTTGSTDMNLTSSRSHAIYTVILRQEIPDNAEEVKDENDISENSNAVPNTSTRKLYSKFHFVDLAGSERMKKTKAVGDRAKEGIAINSGLLAMGKVIHALNDNANHIPYRDSKLTRLLQDALGGNSQTLMIACVSPADSNFGETLNTLNYAARARNIKNKAVQNQDFQAMEVHQLRAEISRLKMELMTARSQSLMPKTTSIANSLTTTDVLFKKENEAMIAEIRRMEVLIYQMQQKNTDLRQELTVARSERDSLLFMQQQNGENSNDKDATVHPLIANYQLTISELQAKLDELESSTLPSSMSIDSISRAESRFFSNTGEKGGFISRTTSNTLLSNHLIQQSPLHKKINATIEKAREEIEKEKQLLEKKRPYTPTKLSDNKQNSDDDDSDAYASHEESGDDIKLNTNAEDDMLNLLDQISVDIRVKEELVTQLQTTQSEYHVMKETYESKLKQMQEQIAAVARERDEAFKRADTVGDKDKNQKNILKTKYADKMKKLTNEMNEIKKKYENVQKELINRRQTNESLINSMKAHVESLKTEKMKLMKRMKDKEMVIREKELEKEREMNKLKRKERQASDLAKKLERSNRMQKILLKQRTDEHVQTQSKLRSVMSLLKKTKNIGSPIGKKIRKMSISSNDERPGSARRSSDNSYKESQSSTSLRRSSSMMSDRDQERLKVQAQFKKNLLYNEVNQFIASQHANEVMDELLKKRKTLQSEKADLEEEVAQYNSRLDQEHEKARSRNVDPKKDETIISMKQLIQDTENRIEILEAEIQYYGARIRSIQIEAAMNSNMGTGDESGENSSELIDQRNNYENAVDLLQSLTQVESKKLLELMLDDLIALKIQDRNRLMEMQSLSKEKTELQRTVEVMKRAAVENAMVNGNHLAKRAKRLSDGSSGKLDAARILDDVASLEDEMNEIERALESTTTSPSRRRTRSIDMGSFHESSLISKNQQNRPPFVPAGNQNFLVAASNSSGSLNTQAVIGTTKPVLNLTITPASAASRLQGNNVFERLHREQTVASQLKMRAGSSSTNVSLGGPAAKPPSRDDNFSGDDTMEM